MMRTQILSLLYNFKFICFCYNASTQFQLKENIWPDLNNYEKRFRVVLCTALEMLLFLKSVGLDKKEPTNPRPHSLHTSILNAISNVDFTFSKKTKLETAIKKFL